MAVKLLSEKYGYSKKEIARYLDWFFGDYAKLGLKELCRQQDIVNIKGLGRFYPTLKGVAAKRRRKEAWIIIHRRNNHRKYCRRKGRL